MSEAGSIGVPIEAVRLSKNPGRFMVEPLANDPEYGRVVQCPFQCGDIEPVIGFVERWVGGELDEAYQNGIEAFASIRHPTLIQDMFSGAIKRMSARNRKIVLERPLIKQAFIEVNRAVDGLLIFSPLKEDALTDDDQIVFGSTGELSAWLREWSNGSESKTEA